MTRNLKAVVGLFVGVAIALGAVGPVDDADAKRAPSQSDWTADSWEPLNFSVSRQYLLRY